MLDLLTGWICKDDIPSYLHCGDVEERPAFPSRTSGVTFVCRLYKQAGVPFWGVASCIQGMLNSRRAELWLLVDLMPSSVWTRG